MFFLTVSEYINSNILYTQLAVTPSYNQCTPGVPTLSIVETALVSSVKLYCAVLT